MICLYSLYNKYQATMAPDADADADADAVDFSVTSRIPIGKLHVTTAMFASC